MKLIKLSTLAIALLISSNCFATSLLFPSDKINYADKANWAQLDVEKDKPVDVFFIYPTVEMGRDGTLIASVKSENYKFRSRRAINMERGLYEDVGRMYIPYYRQAAFTIYSKSLAEQEPYLSFAYQDIREAFKYYMKNYNQNRPVILAGFSQGSDMTIRLMKEFYADKKYRDKLIAAYCIGWRLSKEEKKAFPHLKLAKGEKDTGRIIMFNSEGPDISESLILPLNFKTYSINPLNWKTNNKPADKKLNLGACFVDYQGKITKEVPGLTGAYIRKDRGSLVVPDIKKEDYPANIVENGVYHSYDYQFFYRNLQANIKLRTENYLSKHK